MRREKNDEECDVKYFVEGRSNAMAHALRWSVNRASTATTTRRARERAPRMLQRRSRTRANAIEDVDPEDLALIVELLDSDDGEALREKVDFIANNGLLTTKVVEAARAIAEANERAGSEADIVALLASVHEALKYKFEETAARVMKGALEFAQELMKYFTAEDLEEGANSSVALAKVQLMMREEFEREGGVSKAMLAKYLDQVLPVMDQQDARIQDQLTEAIDNDAAAKIVQVMMQRTKERMQIEYLRDTASRM